MPDETEILEAQGQELQSQEDSIPQEESQSTTETSETNNVQNDELETISLAARNAMAQNKRLQAQIDEMNNRFNQQNAPKEEEVSDDDLFTPKGFRTYVERSLQKSIAPLQQEVQRNAYERSFNGNLNTVLEQAVHLKPFRDTLAPMVASILNGTEPTIQNVTLATNAALGHLVSTNPGIFSQQSSTEQTVTKTNRNLPPRTPNSVPPKSSTPASSKLTEGQKKAKARLGFEGSDDDYINWLNAEEVSF